MAYDRNNIFARILRDEIPSHRVYEDDVTLAFMDVMPQADGHTLVIPKVEAEGILDVPPEALSALALTTLVEPLLILAMGAVVLGIVLAVLMPIIEINQLVR